MASSWIKTVLVPKKVRKEKKREPVVVGETGNYEEWIPVHHLKKDGGAKKRKGGRPSSPSSGSN